MPVHPGAPRALNYLPPSSCVATQLPQATGIAWAAKILKKKTVVLGYLGEGATSAEDFHAGLNFAAVYRAPVVFLCQNNQWAISTPAGAQSASETFAVKALAYGMPGVRVDGNDVFAVYAATRAAVDRARARRRPDADRGGHLPPGRAQHVRRSGALPRPTRPRSGRARIRSAAFAPGCWRAGVVDEAADAALRAQIEDELRAAIAAEESVGPPPVESLIEDVFAEPTTALREQLADLQRIRRKQR